ncbi:MAG: Holliday junction branch migration protein RuvA [Ruminococcus sp.]|nr:Holliday junction branch migration protein RuvA [Candidatus Apopatosoma intestinale]
MFAYIKGELISTEPYAAVVECGGIGYRLTVSGNTIAALSAGNGEVQLYTYLSVREDALELIGFATPEELDAFKLLIGVSGIGPKAAISVLSQLTVPQLIAAVSAGDTKRIAGAPNIGPKTAARIILELKDKFKGISYAEEAGEETVTAIPENAGNRAEAERALMGLGYSQREAEAALRGMDTTLPLEKVMTLVLRKMGSNL